ARPPKAARGGGRGGEGGVPVGLVSRMGGVFDDAKAGHRGIAVPCVHPARGAMRLVGQPVGLSRTPARIERPAPDAGEHTAEVLGAIGLSAADVAALKAQGIV
ncbi:CoA transferase, partial [Azospirillum brasilense]|nr:CoA transferase [Azospirillum brasilense]